MENFMLKKYIKLFRNGQMEAFPIIYGLFKSIIDFYASELSGDDSRQELTLMLIELLYGVKTEKFETDNSDTLYRYIVVSLKHKYKAMKKFESHYAYFNTQLFENSFADSKVTQNEIDALDMLQTLSDKQRDVIIYKFFHNLTDTEISEVLGISRQSVNRLKNRGLEMLRFMYFK